MWERLYGRELNYLEKLEIKINLVDFAKALIKGDLENRERKLKEYRESVRSLLGSDEKST